MNLAPQSSKVCISLAGHFILRSPLRKGRGEVEAMAMVVISLHPLGSAAGNGGFGAGSSLVHGD